MELMSAVLETESSATAARYESLIRIAAWVRARKEPQDLFRFLVDELNQVIPFDAIAQFDDRSNKVDWHMGPHLHKTECSPEEIDEETIAAWVFRTQKSLVIQDLERESRFPQTVRMIREAGIRSFLAFPLTTAHRKRGSLAI